MNNFSSFGTFGSSQTGGGVSAFSSSPFSAGPFTSGSGVGMGSTPQQSQSAFPTFGGQQQGSGSAFTAFGQPQQQQQQQGFGQQGGSSSFGFAPGNSQSTPLFAQSNTPQQSNPFAPTSTPSFAGQGQQQSSTPFGGFGNSAPANATQNAFGGFGSGGGAPSFGGGQAFIGTKQVPWRPGNETSEIPTSNGLKKTETYKLLAIVCSEPYAASGKSLEELRWEDESNQSIAPVQQQQQPQQQQSAAPFGSTGGFASTFGGGAASGSFFAPQSGSGLFSGTSTTAPQVGGGFLGGGQSGSSLFSGSSFGVGSTSSTSSFAFPATQSSAGSTSSFSFPAAASSAPSFSLSSSSFGSTSSSSTAFPSFNAPASSGGFGSGALGSTFSTTPFFSGSQTAASSSLFSSATGAIQSQQQTGVVATVDADPFLLAPKRAIGLSYGQAIQSSASKTSGMSTPAPPSRSQTALPAPRSAALGRSASHLFVSPLHRSIPTLTPSRAPQSHLQLSAAQNPLALTPTSALQADVLKPRRMILAQYVPPPVIDVFDDQVEEEEENKENEQIRLALLPVDESRQHTAQAAQEYKTNNYPSRSPVSTTPQPAVHANVYIHGDDAQNNYTHSHTLQTAQQAVLPVTPTPKRSSIAEPSSIGSVVSSAVTFSHSTSGSATHPPRLTIPVYRTNPPRSQLLDMSDEQLSAVANFTILYEGNFCIEWLDSTDVRDLNLDELIKYNSVERFVEVYPKGTVAHGPGEKLNKPAIVTLFGCFPKNFSGVAPEKRDEKLSLYEKLLKATCKKNGTKFLGYDRRTGEWKQQVYAFAESQDDN